MYICEALLIGVFFALGIYVIYTDFSKGIIPNRILLSVMAFGAIVNGVYYSIWAQQYVINFLINFLVLSVFAVCMYAFHFWAAGDTKLLIAVLLLYPARFYNQENIVIEIEIIIYIFLIAYIYILADTVRSVLRREKFYGTINISKNNIIVFFKDYFISFIYLRGFSYLFSWIFGGIYANNQLLFAFVNVFLAMIIYSKKIFKKWYGIIIMLIINIVFFEGWDGGIYAFNILVLLVAFSLRYLANGYNYQEIETDKVSKGMVLSFITVNKFMISRIKGLPMYTTEDMSSRITDEEVIAIKRWKDSKYGEKTIVIVKKIPFAIFIIMGFCFHFIMGIIR